MIRGVWAWVVLVFLTTTLGVPAAVVSVLRPRSDLVLRCGRFWSRAMLAAVGARIEYSGLERCGGRAPRVFIANHESFVDIWALIRVLPVNTRFVAKQELRRVPALGWAMAASGFVFIDRTNRTRAIESLRRAAEAIRGGRSVVLFAEGTRTRDGRLQPFKKGPFHLALEAGVPVVPVAISGSWAILQPGSVRVRPGTARVAFLDPVDLRRYERNDVEVLLADVRARIARHLHRGEPGG